METLDRRQDLAGWCIMVIMPLAFAPAIVGFDLAGTLGLLFIFTAPTLIFGVSYIIMSRLRKSRRSILMVSTGVTAAYVTLLSLAYWGIHWYLWLVP